jgi:hypothetical protein
MASRIFEDDFSYKPSTTGEMHGRDQLQGEGGEQAAQQLRRRKYGRVTRAALPLRNA